MSTAAKLMGQTRLLVGDIKLDIDFKSILYMPYETKFVGQRPDYYLLFIGLTDKNDLIVTGLTQRIEPLISDVPHTYRMDFAQVLKLEDVLKCTRTGFFFHRKDPGLAFLNKLGKLIDSIGKSSDFEDIVTLYTTNKLEHFDKLGGILKFFEASNFNKHPDIQTKLVSARQELKTLKDNAYGVYSSNDMTV